MVSSYAANFQALQQSEGGMVVFVIWMLHFQPPLVDFANNLILIIRDQLKLGLETLVGGSSEWRVVFESQRVQQLAK